jgi:serine/threonine-protein kinase
VIFGALSAAMFMAGFVWVFYLAIEPYARRQWPRALTGWTRLIRGEWRDPLAGRELLVGAATGVALLAFQSGAFILTAESMRSLPFVLSDLTLNPYGSVLGALSVGLNQVGSTIEMNLVWIVFLLLARRTTRKDVLALGLPIAIVALAATGEARSLPQFLLIYGVVVVNLITTTTLYLRVGFLAWFAAGFTSAVLRFMPFSFTSGSYFAGLTWMAVAVALAPALFGLYTSLAGQSMFFNAPEDR